MWQGGIYVIIKNLNNDVFKTKSPLYSFTQLSLSFLFLSPLHIPSPLQARVSVLHAAPDAPNAFVQGVSVLRNFLADTHKDDATI